MMLIFVYSAGLKAHTCVYSVARFAGWEKYVRRRLLRREGAPEVRARWPGPHRHFLSFAAIVRF